MKKKLLEILVCPSCKGALAASEIVDGEIEDGELRCEKCGEKYPVINGIPRFVKSDNYASSFGYQWNLFRKEQLDSYNGTTLSADRLWSETGWRKEDLKGKWVLDAGCGAGRFIDAASVSGAELVGIDISSAIDAAKDNLGGRPNVHFVQASIYELPFREQTFDYCYCIGVIQHTPNPENSLRNIASMVRFDGEIAVTIYPRRPWTKLYSKYWFRPFTKRMSKEKLLNLIQRVMPAAFPVSDVLFRVPYLGRVFMFFLPIANYVHEKQLSPEQRYAWAVLDTFDMLSPQFDQPMTYEEAARALRAAGIADLTRPTLRALNVVGRRSSTQSG